MTYHSSMGVLYENTLCKWENRLCKWARKIKGHFACTYVTRHFSRVKCKYGGQRGRGISPSAFARFHRKENGYVFGFFEGARGVFKLN